ncbi:MAG: rhodanese-like domain-containing protein [Bacteroidota bacterium]
MTRQILLLLFLFTAAIAYTQNTYNEISLPGLMKKKQQGDTNMVIVDVRTNGEFYDSASRGKQSNIGRIKGAVHIELRDLVADPASVKQLDAYKEKDIYLICSHSYRSRAASNILLKNGFTHINNVQGGMTEWYRRYDELVPYMHAFYETSNSYKNISAAQVASDLIAGKNPLLIGITATPGFFWDSEPIRSLMITIPFSKMQYTSVMKIH